MGLALSIELHVRLAAVRSVPQQHPVAALDQFFAQRPQTFDVLTEPPPGRQYYESAFVTEDFVDDVAAVDLDPLLASHFARLPLVPVLARASLRSSLAFVF